MNALAATPPQQGAAAGLRCRRHHGLQQQAASRPVVVAAARGGRPAAAVLSATPAAHALPRPCEGHCGARRRQRGSALVVLASSQQQQQQQPPANDAASRALVPLRSLEQLITRSFDGSALGGRWQQIETCWVLRPPEGVRTEAVCLFAGGAFVGAAPQLTYRAFLEALSSRGVVVIACPFQTSFDQLRLADELAYRYDRCLRALAPEGLPGSLPVFGVGHSLGSLLHALIGARYAGSERAGNILLSFNNRPASDSIPFLSSLIAPGARAVGPLLQQLAASPLRGGLETAADALRGVSPGLVRELLPLIDQLNQLYVDVAAGTEEFTPPPNEVAEMLRRNYAVGRNLLIRFRDDTIDGSIALANLLEDGAAIQTAGLDLTLRTLDGDHLRPVSLGAGVGGVELPPEVSRVATQAAATGGTLLGRLADMAQQVGGPSASAPLQDLARGVNTVASMLESASTTAAAGAAGGGAGGAGAGGAGTNSSSASVQALADEVAAFMGVGGVVTQGPRALLASAVVQQRGGGSGSGGASASAAMT